LRDIRGTCQNGVRAPANRPEEQMNQYKFYFLDERDHICSAQDHLLRDDLDALTTAKNLGSNRPIEIWQGARQGARVRTDDKALNASDEQ